MTPRDQTDVDGQGLPAAAFPVPDRADRVVAIVGRMIVLGIAAFFATMLALIGVGVLHAVEEVDDALRAIAAAPWWILPVIALAYGLTVPLQALRWRALIEAIRPGGRLSVRALSGFIFTGMIFNVAIPGPAGDVASCVFLRRRAGVPLAAAFSAMVFSRLVAVVVLGVLGVALCFAPGVCAADPRVARILSAVAVAVAIGTAGLVVVSLRPGVLQAAAGAVSRVAARLWPRRAVASLAALREAIDDLGRMGWWCRAVLVKGPRPMLVAAGCSLLIIAPQVAALWATGAAFGVKAPLGAFALLHVLNAFAQVAVILIPGGLGVSEVALVALARTLLDLPLAQALAFYSVFRVGTLLYLLAALPVSAVVWRAFRREGMRLDDVRDARRELRALTPVGPGGQGGAPAARREPAAVGEGPA